MTEIIERNPVVTLVNSEENIGSKKHITHSFLHTALMTCVSLILPILVFAQTENHPTSEYTFDANGVHVEVAIGQTDQPERSAEVLAEYINANTSDVNIASDPAIEIATVTESPESTVFANAFQAHLQQSHTPVDRRSEWSKQGLADLENAYYKNSNLIWTIVRVSTSTGLRVATFVYSGFSWEQSVLLSSSLVVACSLSAALYIPINHFANKVRFYEVVQGSVADQIHGRANWGLLEVVFGSIVILGENGMRKVLGIASDVPCLLQFSVSTGLAMFTQQIWDRAVGKYEDLQKLKMLLGSGMSSEELTANIRKRGAFGSVLSVMGFTASASSYVPVKILGYATLATLGGLGRWYEKRMDRELANCRKILQASAGSK